MQDLAEPRWGPARERLEFLIHDVDTLPRGTLSDRTERQDDSVTTSRARATAEAHLCVVNGAPDEPVHSLASAGLVLGRTPQDDTEPHAVVSDTRISRRHVRVALGDRGWQLTDLGSRNGGYVDGAHFEPHATVSLDDGSVVRLGDSLLVFREGPASSGASEPSFPGISATSERVRARVRSLAHGDGHVLVLGETGTGKERVARALGEQRPPFVVVNCAELSHELARGELFGHVRGAFSGATGQREGLVAEAGDGTLFLDEIGELDQGVQADLLRFLEDGCYRPLGSNELRQSKARVVAATNLPLDEAVQSGRFRRDLLARLRAVNGPLELPPLRERREDIFYWARRFFDEALEGGVYGPLASAGAAECLLLHSWPENLRELRGIIRAAAREGGAPIVTEKLPSKVREVRVSVRSRDDARSPTPAAKAPGTSHDPTREEIERALKDAGGRMRAAAEQLGIDRRKLYRLCEKLGIDIDSHRDGD